MHSNSHGTLDRVPRQDAPLRVLEATAVAAVLAVSIGLAPAGVRAAGPLVPAAPHAALVQRVSSNSVLVQGDPAVVGEPMDAGHFVVQGEDGAWAPVGGGCQPHGQCGCGHCRSCGPRDAGILNRAFRDFCQPRWTVQADALMLWQSAVASRPLFIDTGTDLPALDVNDIGAPMSVGPRVGIFMQVDRCNSIEANYFYVDGFDGVGSLLEDGSVYAMNDLAGPANVLSDILSGDAYTAGAINSLELNWRRWNGRSIQWLLGFRWVQWNESLAIIDDWDDTVNTGIDVVDVSTKNDLYGAQIGFDALLLNVHDRLLVNAIGKGGLYANAARATGFTGGDRLPNTEVDVGATPVAFVGEVGLVSTLRLNDHWSFRLGYNFFWLSGLATAAEQLDSIDTDVVDDSTIDTDGSVFLSGANIGFELAW